jgi:hypothetical protein
MLAPRNTGHALTGTPQTQQLKLYNVTVTLYNLTQRNFTPADATKHYIMQLYSTQLHKRGSVLGGGDPEHLPSCDVICMPQRLDENKAR